jgi:CYTH domain-containing protein
MGTEIERKFLVQNDNWRALGQGKLYRQGYLTTNPDCTVRVRIAGDQGYLTIKGATTGISRAEYEYGIPLEDAAQLLDTLCQPPLIEKTRDRIPAAKGLVWEVDEFAGENQGLIIAEIELPNAEQSVELPDWIGPEVSNDPRYFNSNLSKHPFSHW